MGVPCSAPRPEETMWQLIVRKCTPPTRVIRYCCDVLKERGGSGRFTITGVRWAESNGRKSKSGMFQPNKKDGNGNYVYSNDNNEAKRMVEQCTTKSKFVLNPIIDWTDTEVWQFIKGAEIPYCKLYDEGFKRLGCIGCPMAGKGREKEFERWPTYKRAYLRAFDKMLKERERRGMKPFMNGIKTAEDVMSWWMEENKTVKQEEGQIDMGIGG